MNNQEFAHLTIESSDSPSRRDEPTEVARTAPGPMGAMDNRSAELVNPPPVTPMEVVDNAPIGLDDAQLSTETGNNASPSYTLKVLRNLSSFWHNRVIEAGLILSMGLYYLVGNSNFGASSIFHVPPYLYSLPFLVIFALLSWYRLAFAVALMPLALPYYLLQKTVFSHGSHHYDFSLAEISLAVIALVALGQFLWQGKRWRYRLTWQDLLAWLGPFAVPMLLFVVVALISVVMAMARQIALRAFREEIFDPLVYVLLALCCLRRTQDVKRLLGAFLGSVMIIAIIGLVQYFFFANQLQQSLGGGRVLAVYGSANSIGLFFDYVLPIGMALLIFQLGQALHGRGKWWLCALMLIGFVPLVGVLIFSQSLGTALALPVALLFILAFSVRNGRTLLIGTGALVILALVTGVLLHKQLTHFITNWHDNSKGVSTFTKRYYLWQVALNMIHSYPWFGVGLDNWLCHYTINTVCPTTDAIPHFILIFIPGTHMGTGLGEEQTLSHPHETFLQIWVSMGVFGLLAFLALLALFSWLFVRVIRTVRRSSQSEIASLEWVVLGIGSAMLAALCQGLVDSSFLEQDLAFCFWMLVVVLFILRTLTGTPWRGRPARQQ